MRRLLGLVRRPRLVDEAWFVLGGGATGAVVGTLLAALTFDVGGAAMLPGATVTRWYLAVAPGFGYGWWAGVGWSVVLSLVARRRTPPHPVVALLPATVAAAAALFLIATVLILLALPTRVIAIAAIVAAAITARWRLRGVADPVVR